MLINSFGETAFGFGSFLFLLLGVGIEFLLLVRGLLGDGLMGLGEFAFIGGLVVVLADAHSVLNSMIKLSREWCHLTVLQF